MVYLFEIHLVVETIKTKDKNCLEKFYKDNKMSLEEKSKIMDKCSDITKRDPVMHFHIPISTQSLSFYKQVPIDPKHLVLNKWFLYCYDAWGCKFDAQECFHYFTNDKTKFQYFFVNNSPPKQWLEKIAKIYTNLKFTMYIKYNCNKKEVVTYN